jgi:hypothetical protein
MKNLLFLPLVLVSCLCFAQDAKEIIGKPIKIGNLLVAQNDFPNVMNWNDAKLACQNLGKGWRLPSKTELNILYKNRKKIGGFMYLYYWSSTKIDNYDAWVQFFDFGAQNNYGKEATTNVRAVRSL